MDVQDYETLVARHSVNSEPYRTLPWIQGLLLAPAVGFYGLRVFMAGRPWYDENAIMALATAVFLAGLSPRLAEARRLVSRLMAEESKGVILALGKLTTNAALLAFRLIVLVAGIAMYQPSSPDPAIATTSASAVLGLAYIAASSATLFWATSKKGLPLIRDVVLVGVLYWFGLLIFTIVGPVGPLLTYPLLGLILVALTRYRIENRKPA